eukprot:TRINITY_DN22121_c0_g1_i7.p1 TRINITY_DN22121_c0_g1~~TRINITY_DN22121_c0_g1_i7.p1  ORF type:complete len:243 (-),score=22.40 TRINITY_DN22121_c0_g1_i7:104-832(-)
MSVVQQRPPTKIELEEKDKQEVLIFFSFQIIVYIKLQEMIKNIARCSCYNQGVPGKNLARNLQKLKPFFHRKRPIEAVESDLEVKPMEVEIKLRLAQAAHSSLLELLKPYYQTTYNQENYFFDGINKELSTQKVVLRLRFFNEKEKATITIKGRQVLKDGVGVASEQETDVDPIASRNFLNNPDELFKLDDPLLKDLKSYADQLCHMLYIQMELQSTRFSLIGWFQKCQTCAQLGRFSFRGG